MKKSSTIISFPFAYILVTSSFLSCRIAVSDGFALGNSFKIIKHPFKSIFFYVQFFSREITTQIKVKQRKHLFKVLKIDLRKAFDLEILDECENKCRNEFL